jgi:hypothetical protein
MPNEGVIITGGKSRVFSIEGQAGPDNVPFYHSWAAAGSVEQPVGDITRVEAPSVTEYGGFDVVGEVLGAEENATITLTLQDRMSVSEVLGYARRRCPFDLQIHQGSCQDPRDFDAGWDKIRVFERARATGYSTDDLGSLESGDVGKVTESLDVSALRYYEILPMTYAEKATTEVTNEIIAISVCDKPSCGDCNNASNGCSKVFAISAPAGSSPGLGSEVIFTDDGFATAGDSPITTLAAGQDPDDATCVGPNLVVVSNSATGFGIHWAPSADILDGTEVWTKVTTGLVAAHYPTCITSASPRDTWMGGDGGYIYFATDPTNGVTVQEAGALSVQNINDIYAFSTKLVVAVGALNTILYTTNGSDWSLIAGPAALAAVNLNCVTIRGETEWWIGAANGSVYYTTDSGAHWSLKAFPGSGAGSIEAIAFASDTVGYISHKTAAPKGVILRTISGGNTWYIVPEGTSTVPAADAFNSIAVCIDEANILYAGGLADNAADGIIIKGSY